MHDPLADLRDEAVAQAVTARIAGDHARAEERDRLQRLVESVTQPRGTYRPGGVAT